MPKDHCISIEVPVACADNFPNPISLIGTRRKQHLSSLLIPLQEPVCTPAAETNSVVESQAKGIAAGKNQHIPGSSQQPISIPLEWNVIFNDAMIHVNSSFGVGIVWIDIHAGNVTSGKYVF